MMSAARVFGLGAACALFLTAGPLVDPAEAQDACKGEVITATGPPKIAIRRQRQLDGGGSAMREAVAAWTREAESRFGNEFKNWDRAKDSKFNCSPSGTASVQCTISGRPCSVASERREPERVERVTRDRRDDDNGRRGDRRRDRIGDTRGSRRDRDYDDDRDTQDYGYVRGQYLEDDDYRHHGRRHRHRHHWGHRHGHHWGDGRNRCAEVQYFLQTCGYYVIRDGVCGPVTSEALASFQHRHGLYPSGYANSTTTEALIRRCIR
jgi:peptidoglycan hydrolase-like protein with peptidoglycan-binding domain